MSKPWDVERKKHAAITGAVHRTVVGAVPNSETAIIEVPWEFGYALDWFWGTPITVELRENGVFIQTQSQRKETESEG